MTFTHRDASVFVVEQLFMPSCYHVNLGFHIKFALWNRKRCIFFTNFILESCGCGPYKISAKFQWEFVDNLHKIRLRLFYLVNLRQRCSSHESENLIRHRGNFTENSWKFPWNVKKFTHSMMPWSCGLFLRRPSIEVLKATFAYNLLFLWNLLSTIRYFSRQILNLF